MCIYIYIYIYIYIGILFNCQKNEILPFTETWMDLEIFILTEVRHTEANIYYHLCVESKKVRQINFFFYKNRLTDFKNKLAITKRERQREGKIWSFVLTYTYHYIKNR